MQSGSNVTIRRNNKTTVGGANPSIKSFFANASNPNSTPVCSPKYDAPENENYGSHDDEFTVEYSVDNQFATPHRSSIHSSSSMEDFNTDNVNSDFSSPSELSTPNGSEIITEMISTWQGDVVETLGESLSYFFFARNSRVKFVIIFEKE